jgi:hypothetical protein
MWHKPSMELEPDLVAVRDAARTLGISRQALDKKLAARGVEVERRLVRGRILVFLRKETVEALGDSSTVFKLPSTSSPLNQRGPVDEVDEIRRELHELRVANAKLEGELAAALKVEAATGRFADKLEARLDEARRQHESELGKLQRELGRQETAILLLRERERERASGSFLARLLGR